MDRRNLDDANAFLLGGDKVPSASFLTKGTVHQGEVLDFKLSQQTDAQTRKPLTWDNGDPKMQLVVTIQTDERDPEIEDDDGRRRLYLKYKSLQAAREAIAESKAGILERGGWLGLEFTSQDKPAKRTVSGVKNFEAWYESPDPDAAVNAYLEGDESDPAQGGSDEPADVPVAEPERAVEPARAARASRGRVSAAKVEDAATAPARGRGRGRAASGAY